MEKWNNFVVRVDVEFAGVHASVHELCGYADYPDCTENVVDVAVSDEQVMNVLQCEACVIELMKDSVSTSSVDQEGVSENETCVVAFGNEGIAGS